MSLLSYDWSIAGVTAIMFAEGWDADAKTPINMTTAAKMCSFWNEEHGMDEG